ncbi:MAG: type IV toxin-antitoxin system AbiEi family antitoxin domain-containing protein [Candidatus Dormibacteria bacterium]
MASTQAGYFTAVQARGCGYSHALLAHHAATGRFIRAHRGLYRLRRYPSSSREEVVAAWLAMGEGAVVSQESALELLRLSDVIPDAIHLTVPRGRRSHRGLVGTRAHTTTSMPGLDQVTVRDGMPVTSPARTILDVAQVGGAPDQVATAIRQAIQRGLVTPEQLLAGAAVHSSRVERLVRNALYQGGA